MFKSDLMQDLQIRGCIKDCSDAAGLDALLARGVKVVIYGGFDPTADSLHAGHLMLLTLMRRFAAHGHTVVPVLGTATALVGDPSGRSEARPMLDEARMTLNTQGITRSIRMAVGPGDIRVRENGEWFGGMGWISFLREVGALVPVGRMLALESVRSRMEAATGLSFLEFSYSLMQGFDFLTLAREHEVLIQAGGSDQWGNICMGLELIGKRPVPGHHAFGMTHPLLARANGEKMGKSASGAVWLNSDRMPDFDFFQFWRTLDDADIARLALLLSERPVAELEPLLLAQGRSLEAAKESLAEELTARVRGQAAAAEALAASRGRGANGDGLKATPVAADEIADLAALLVRCGLAESKAAARRLAAQGGVRVNGEKRDTLALVPDDFRNGVAVLSAGRTRHAALTIAAG